MARASKESAHKKYERQKELGRERQRRRRAKLSEEDLAKKRQYDRDRYKELKSQKKRKSINELSERDRRRKRKQWRKYNKTRKEKNEALAAALQDTSPGTPIIAGSPEETTNKKRGRRSVRRDRAKAYRDLKKQTEKVEELERKLRKYKKRLEREKKKNKNSSPSPRKKVTLLVGKSKISPKIRKQLFVGMVLKRQLETRAKAVSKSLKETQQFRKSVGNAILKKYRVQRELEKIMPYKANKTIKKNPDPNVYTRKTRTGVREKLREELLHFYEDDTVSKMCPGKRDVISQGKIKKQRRILLYSLRHLHKIFMEETHLKISLSSFTRAKPFWVTFPKQSDRETCGCIKHSNIEFLVDSLRKTRVIEQKNITEVVTSIVCSTKNYTCMFGKCDLCKNEKIKYNYDKENDFKIKYFRWINTKKETTIKNKKKIVKKTVRAKIVKRVSNVIELFEQELVMFKRHLFCAIHQSSQLKAKLKNLGKNELLFRVDFAENYVAKYSEEIQSVHFGASKHQISLHTGVRYSHNEANTKHAKNKKHAKVAGFCTVSDNLDHQCHAIWSHLLPILTETHKKYPDTETIHFFTDSPTSQYRNRINMHLFSKFIPGIFKKVRQVTWNFTEAGHGKGPMDGIGGSLKREADRKVRQGHDIIKASEFIKVHSGSKVYLSEIAANQIATRKDKVAGLKIPPINGITKCRQVTFCKKNNLMFGNSLSCFKCPTKKPCIHFHLFEVFPKDPKPKTLLKVDDVYTSSDEEELWTTLMLQKKTLMQH